MKLDNETLAISAIVLALLLYYGTRTVKTGEEIKRDQDYGRFKIHLKNLQTLEDAFSALPDLERRSVEVPLPTWVEQELTQMARDLHNLTNELAELPAGIVDQSVSDRVDHLMHSIQENIKMYDDEVRDKERHQSVAVKVNAVSVTANTLIHNQFDQRSQTLDQRHYTLQEKQIQIDARTANFNQSNVEQRTLHLNNPHAEVSTPSEYSDKTRMSEDVPRITYENQTISDAEYAQAEAMYHLIQPEVSNGRGHSGSTSRESHTTSAGGRDVGGVYGHLARSQTGGGTEAGSFMQISPSPNASNADERLNTQLNGGANVKAIAQRNEHLRSKSATTVKTEAESFKSAPTVEKNNVDRTPGKAVTAVPSPAEATDVLQTMDDDTDSVFEEGGKRKEIPESPADIRARSKKHPAKLLKTSVEVSFRQAKIQSSLKKLRNAKQYEASTVMVLETLIRGLVDDIPRMARHQRESFLGNKVHWEDVIAKHKKHFGQREVPFRAGKGSKGRSGSLRKFKDIDTRSESITRREEKHITERRKTREETQIQRREDEERRQLGPVERHPSAEGVLGSAAFGITTRARGGLSESAVVVARPAPPKRPALSPMRDDALGPHGDAVLAQLAEPRDLTLKDQANQFIEEALREGMDKQIQRY